MKFENTEVWGFEHAFRGLRNPKNSWNRSDSKFNDYYDEERADVDFDELLKVYPNAYIHHCNINGYYTDIIGEADLKLAQTLIKAGNEHRKFMRQIFVSVDITAPLYWGKEFDTYKVGTVANSTSFMHKGLSKEFDINDFENDLRIDTLYNSNNGHEVPTEDITEEWKDVIGYEDLYKISNKGKIIRKEFSKIDRMGINRTYSEKEIFPSINSSGYKKIVLRKNGVGKNEYLHRLLAIHFIPNPDNLPNVNHKDGNKLNCNLSNLEWCTVAENSQHAYDNDLRYVTGYNRTIVGNNTRRFSEDDVLEIKRYYNDGWTQKEIAEYMGCYDSTINNIVNGKNYNTPECEAIDDWKYIINRLNKLRIEYLETKDKNVWRHITQILPESYNQTRTITMNYENVRNMYFQRRNHKLTEWSESFIKWVESLPYAEELIMYDGKSENP